ncbi:MAG TPA: FAD-binding protein, partial [Baekduia sp.]|nr:FAD-binding protein [Baekduia sp.]
GLRGIVEYDPAELTFTALAGTPVAEVAAALGEHAQHLPFDPPLVDAGATLGGAVAAGTSGPGAIRHGGVRDFVIGVRLIDGTGRVIAGGGKVVKNAAGFDLPKLLVGSIGRLGIMTQLSFKVFPRPRSTTTLAFALGSTEDAVTRMTTLVRGPQTLDALDLEAGGRLLVRLGGDAATLEARAARVARTIGSAPERVDGPAEAELWHDASEFTWAPRSSALARVALTARHVLALESATAGAALRVSLGGNVAWIAWPGDRPLDELDQALQRLDLAGLVLRGAAAHPLLGARRGGAFAERVGRALDPHSRFLEV